MVTYKLEGWLYKTLNRRQNVAELHYRAVEPCQPGTPIKDFYAEKLTVSHVVDTIGEALSVVEKNQVYYLA